mmetsp:Transcript_37880/g.100810  ORF Transcript_37880/g.100810 Transcript_37880/m.100810 type:complete len:747 (-) Transcript_37880:721-2961(-)
MHGGKPVPPINADVQVQLTENHFEFGGGESLDGPLQMGEVGTLVYNDHDDKPYVVRCPRRRLWSYHCGTIKKVSWLPREKISQEEISMTRQKMLERQLGGRQRHAIFEHILGRAPRGAGSDMEGFLSGFRQNAMDPRPRFDGTVVDASNASVGLEVVRGPDWATEDEDGGPGNIGTIMEVHTATRQARVQWSSKGYTGDYRIGSGGKFDLQLASSARVTILRDEDDEFSEGDQVQLSKDYMKYPSDREGPLQPGEVGVVLKNEKDMMSCHVRTSRRLLWLYHHGAIAKVPGLLRERVELSTLEKQILNLRGLISSHFAEGLLGPVGDIQSLLSSLPCNKPPHESTQPVDQQVGATNKGPSVNASNARLGLLVVRGADRMSGNVDGGPDNVGVIIETVDALDRVGVHWPSTSQSHWCSAGQKGKHELQAAPQPEEPVVGAREGTSWSVAVVERQHGSSLVVFPVFHVLKSGMTISAEAQIFQSLHGNKECRNIQVKHPMFGLDLKALPEKLQTSRPHVIHIACHDTLGLEFGEGDKDSSENLKISVQGSNAQFVFLNACSTFELGLELIEGGVPYVICWDSEVDVSTCIAFAIVFYSFLNNSDHLYGGSYWEACKSMGTTSKVPLLIWFDDTEVDSRWLSSNWSRGILKGMNRVIGPTRNWKAPKNAFDWAALAGAKERECLEALGYRVADLYDEGTSNVQARFINEHGRLSKEALEKLFVDRYSDLWGTRGHVVTQLQKKNAAVCR